MRNRYLKSCSRLLAILLPLSLYACAMGGGDEGTGMLGGGDESSGLTILESPVRSYEGGLISLPALQINDIRPPKWLRGNWELNQTQASEFTAEFSESSISFNSGLASLTFGKENADIEVTQHDDTSFAWKIDYRSNSQPLTISFGCTRIGENDLVCSYATVDNIQVHFKMARV